MAGLLIKELKIRGLAKRTLVVTPANLSFQWQRELKDKFRESFEVIRSDVLRANYGSNRIVPEPVEIGAAGAVG
jgi:SNF2 family DNA or RNA helicase